MVGDISDDCLHLPIAVAILNIASIPLGQELRIIDITARPVFWSSRPGPNANFWLRVFFHGRLLPTERARKQID